MAQRQGAALSPQAPALSSLWPPHRGPPQAHLLPTVLCPSLPHWGPFLSGPCTPHKWVGWRDWQANPVTQRRVVPWAFCSEAVTFLPASLQLRNVQFPQPSVTVARQGLPRPLPWVPHGPCGRQRQRPADSAFCGAATPGLAPSPQSEMPWWGDLRRRLAPGGEGVRPASAMDALCDPREATEGSEPRLPQM